VLEAEGDGADAALDELADLLAAADLDCAGNDGTARASGSARVRRRARYRVAPPPTLPTLDPVALDPETEANGRSPRSRRSRPS
jgi:hypothetical protein